VLVGLDHDDALAHAGQDAGERRPLPVDGFQQLAALLFGALPLGAALLQCAGHVVECPPQLAQLARVM
jgi:hypothetical protein